MLTLFTQQEAHDMEIASERKEAARAAEEAQAKQIAFKLRNKMPDEEIAETVDFPLPTVKFRFASAQA